jgi:hypothetical protein
MRKLKNAVVLALALAAAPAAWANDAFPRAHDDAGIAAASTASDGERVATGEASASTTPVASQPAHDCACAS